MKLTKNFTSSEVACKCGQCTGLPHSPEALDYFMDKLKRLQIIREEYAKPMYLSSGYRCPDHNQLVSSTGRTGPHTFGAFDVKVYGHDAHILLSIASGYCLTEVAAPTGIGINQKGPKESRFIHFDWETSPPRPWIWTY